MKTRNLVPGVFLVTALTVSACASNANDASTTGGGDADAVKAYSERLAGYEGAKPDITIKPLSSRPPTGKAVAIINCAVPVCGLYTDAAKKAADALGWHTTVVTTQFTPESYKAAWDSVVEEKPDVVFAAAVLPSSIVQSEVTALHNDGAIILTYAGDAPAGQGTPYLYSKANAAEQTQQGVVQGLIAIDDAHGGPKVLFLAVPDTPSAAPTGKALKETVQEAGGSYSEIEVNSADIGTAAPAQVVSYLQAHPDIEYVCLPWDDWIAGLPQALKSAGLDSVKVIGTAANATSEQAVSKGQMFRSVVHPTAQNAWFMIDAAVRELVGDPVGDANPPGPVAVVSPDNVDEIGDASSWPHLDSQFLKAWQVG
jgi:ABC-type sugar transport system substrate-binding protein